MTFHKNFTSLSHYIHSLHLLNLENSNLYTNSESPKILISRSQKSRVFHDVGHENFVFKIFRIFYLNTDFFDLPPKFHIFTTLFLPPTSLEPYKIILLHKSSKSSNIDFKVTESYVFHDFRHGNFGVKIFCNFFRNIDLFPTFKHNFIYLSRFIISLHRLTLKIHTCTQIVKVLRY